MTYDACIIGSGFAGSLLAWLLARNGLSVLLLDSQRHPRFAIGESSTPLADFLLEQLADEYSLPELKPLSRWGSWQRTLPQLRAGKKRGFSYFAHSTNQPFFESEQHERSWLVAASASDDLSDTHWMRADVDAWFCDQAQAAGAVLHDNTRLAAIRFDPQRDAWNIEASDTRDATLSYRFQARFLVDSSGSGGVVGKFLSIPSADERLLVRSATLFAHFRNVGRMRSWQLAHALSIEDDPFNADDAAQHHLTNEGWCWMLRFSEGTTSVGYVSPNLSDYSLADPSRRWQVWQQWLAEYPTLHDLLADAQIVAPEPNQLVWLPRISRLWSQAASTDIRHGPWAMLPGTVGIVDPLHSTGIAHSLWGVRELSRLLLKHLRTGKQGNSEQTFEAALRAYSQTTIAEVLWIDRIVESAYRSLQSFELFQAACGLYFIAAIHSERQLAAEQHLSNGFLLHQDQQLQAIIQSNLQQDCKSDPKAQAAWLRRQLADWDDIGLYDPSHRNRISRSAAPKG